MSEWSTTTLAKVAEIRFSNVDKKRNRNELNVRLCNYMDVYSNDYITRDLPFMEASVTHAEYERFKVEQGDVLITKDSETPDDIGIPSAVMDKIPNLVCGYHLALIKPNQNKIDSVYLAKQLGSNSIARYFSKLANGSTRYGLSSASISSTPLPLAPLQQQHSIAEILSTVDEAIEQTEALIHKYQQIKAGLMHDLFTRGVTSDGRLRPTQAQAPHLYKNSPLGWIPKKWEVQPIGELADLDVGFAFKSQWFCHEGVNLLRGENVGYGKPDWQDRQCLTLSMAAQFPSYALKAGDIVIGMDRTFTESGVKISVLSQEDCPALLVQRVGRFRPLACEMGYLRWLVETPLYLRSLSIQQKGMDIPHLSKDEILTPRVPIAHPDEQKKIAYNLKNFELALECEYEKSNKLQALKKGLMHDLLTGRVRVKVGTTT